MSLRLKIVSAAIVLIFAFPQRAMAGESGLVARFEARGRESRLAYEEIHFYGAFGEGEKAWAVFYNLLCMDGDGFVPQGVKLLGVTVERGGLAVNVSREIKDYGGTYNEKHLAAQIALTGLALQGVDFVTLLIEGEREALPEGYEIYRISEWDELMDS